MACMNIEPMRTISFDGETVYTVPCPVEAAAEMTQPVGVDGDGKLFTAPGGGGSGGTTDHSQLSNRDAADQHPMSAITGLQNEFGMIADALDDVADWVEGLRTGKQDKLTAGSNISIVNNVISATGGGGGEAVQEIFDVTYNTTQFADIYAAAQAGKVCRLILNGEIYFLTKFGLNSALFWHIGTGGVRKFAACSSDNVWQSANANVQTTASKVTEITDTSTDVQYPSAKAVYDFVQSAVGDLSSVLGSGVIS